MTASRPQPPGPHEAALLLPWYVGGTLGDGERLFVEAHLRECAECRSELESVEDVRQRTRAMFGSGPVPSARLHARVMARVRESQPAAPSPLRSVAEALQWLLRPKWAPVLAALLIVVQAGALGWFALQGSLQPEVRTRSVEAGAARIRVVFNPRATEAEIRTALTALGGRIVDGPSQDGAYIVELPSLAPTVLSQRLRELRQRPGLVERIENAAP